MNWGQRYRAGWSGCWKRRAFRQEWSNFVPGLGRSTGKALTEHGGLAKLDVTGGTETGRVIAAAAGRSLIPVTAELGGKAPVIVFDDVDIDSTVAGALFAAFMATGQTCVQGARILVSRSIYEPFVTKLVERTRGLRLGDPLDVQTQIGPLVSQAQRDKTAAAVDKAREQGATVLAGGRVPDGAAYADGWFYEPTIVADVGLDDDLWREEVFGPVSVVAPFDDEDDAVQLANDCPFGLAASVWTKNVGRAVRVSRRLDIGIIWVNDHHRIDPASPWGGFKDSGIGSENGSRRSGTTRVSRAWSSTPRTLISTGSGPSRIFGTRKESGYGRGRCGHRGRHRRHPGRQATGRTSRWPVARSWTSARSVPMPVKLVDASGDVRDGGRCGHACASDGPGDAEREDFPTGTSAAAASGVTTIIEHVTGRPVRSVPDLIEKVDYLATAPTWTTGWRHTPGPVRPRRSGLCGRRGSRSSRCSPAPRTVCPATTPRRSKLTWRRRPSPVRSA